MPGRVPRGCVAGLSAEPHGPEQSTESVSAIRRSGRTKNSPQEDTSGEGEVRAD